MHFDGKTYYYEIVKQAVYDSNGIILGIIGMVTDVTQITEMKNKLEEISVTDILTGAYNRTYLHNYISKGIDELRLPISLVIGDCNNLKYMNDVHGHRMGDQYLIKTVELIRENVEEQTPVIRYGGDEFLIVFENCTEEQCEAIIKMLMEKSREYQINGMELSIAFGYNTIKDKNVDIHCEIEKADQNMYKVKKMMKQRLREDVIAEKG